jgi:hypothetical protein
VIELDEAFAAQALAVAREEDYEIEYTIAVSGHSVHGRRMPYAVVVGDPPPKGSWQG